MRCVDGITNSKDTNLVKLQDMVRVREAWCAAVHGVMKSQTQPDDRTITKKIPYLHMKEFQVIIKHMFFH